MNILKQRFLTLLFLFSGLFSFGQVGIGTTSPKAALDVVSSTQGFIMPRVADHTSLAISADQKGMQVYNTSTNSVWIYNGASWTEIAVKFVDGTTAADAVYTSGNVGIGTTTPGAKLEVAGHIWQTGTGSSVFIGEGAGAVDDLTENSNVFVGKEAGFSNTEGAANSANVYQALYSNTTGEHNTANGTEALFSNTIGNNNTANGSGALYSNTTGEHNTANGAEALYNTTGKENTANGSGALYSNTTGERNTADGYEVLFTNKAGSNGVAIGFGSQRYANDISTAWINTNTSVGYESLRGSIIAGNNTGVANTANGYQALYSNTTGKDNTANGYQALYSNTTGEHNTAIGFGAFPDNTTGSNNVAYGFLSGIERPEANPNELSNNSVFLGAYTSSFASNTTNEIVIGYEASGVGSNSVVLGNDAITKTLLKGSVGIGTNVPSHKLDVVGTAGLSTGTAWTNTSDMRLKEDVKAYTRGLSEILKINPIYYSYTEASGLKNEAKYGQNIGISAQELKQIIPEAITVTDHKMKDGTILKGALELTKADAMWFALINAIKEQQAMIVKLQNENVSLKVELSKIDELSSEINTIKRALNKNTFVADK